MLKAIRPARLTVQTIRRRVRPGSARLDDAGVVRRAGDLEAFQQATAAVEDAEAALPEPRRDDPAVALLDVVPDLRDAGRPPRAPVPVVHAERSAVAARHERDPAAEGDVLRR